MVAVAPVAVASVVVHQLAVVEEEMVVAAFRDQHQEALEANQVVVDTQHQEGELERHQVLFALSLFLSLSLCQGEASS